MDLAGGVMRTANVAPPKPHVKLGAWEELARVDLDDC